MDGLPVERIVDCVAKTVPRKSVFLVSIATSDVGCGGMYNGTLYALIDYRPQRSKLIEKIS
ncbi:MAG: hypothetical protein C0622_04905 [Desulfuromonas sp.]|nr:MAG: hypothetical protein C0622_04905 [Desulfuromonas sp.]